MGVNTDSDELNTEYLPTKCRITRPPPPKPATNPLQFIKVGPCPLNKKAQEQVKKAEEIKVIRHEVREEPEDWQHNLDNWKSSRRKRQEHIIERVEEVKKSEQREQERGRRRSTTFNEIVEKRNRGRGFNIPIYDDDSNDLSDYGIGSSSSKTNSIKDVETDDNSSILDEKEQNTYDSACSVLVESTLKESLTNSKKPKSWEPPELPAAKPDKLVNENSNELIEQYTYEGAIQDYRSRIRTKININESIFNTVQDYTRKDQPEPHVPKGNLFKKKEIFEADKNSVEINSYESNTSRRLSEDFANSQSIKERLLNLEKCTDQSIKSVDKNEFPAGTVKSRLQKFNQISDFDTKNNNNSVKLDVKLTSSLLSDKNDDKDIKNWNYNGKGNLFENCSSAEEYVFTEKLSDIEFTSSNYAPSTSSTDLMGLSSDREDSGIHTADVSCSVSQSDEAFEETEFTSNTIPKCIEKLNKEKMAKDKPTTEKNLLVANKYSEFDSILTLGFLNSEQTYSSQCLEYEKNKDIQHSSLVENIEKTIKQQEDDLNTNEEEKLADVKSSEIKSLNTLDLTNYPIEYISDDIFNPLIPPKLQPPSEKPPPLPPMEADDEIPAEVTVRRLNSTKRIKKEIHIKRSSFLGLEQPTDDQIDPDVPINGPPDINSFLQKESRLEKSVLFKKLHETDSQGTCNDNKSAETEVAMYSKDEKQSQNNISPEDELRKQEQEIIELIEKEEKNKDCDTVESRSRNFVSPVQNYIKNNSYDNLGSKKFDRPYFPEVHYNNLDDHDSEVLKVEHELLQLEREELERQRENILFREKSAKMKQNRHSYENICDVEGFFPDKFDYRKSMPELQHPPVEFQNQPECSNYDKPIDNSVQYRKSMPDIQHAYNRSVNEYCNPAVPCELQTVDHRKSMPELQQPGIKSAFATTPLHQPIMPGKPIKPISKDQKERFMHLNPTKSDVLFASRQSRPIIKQGVQALSAVPQSRYISNNWIRPKTNPEVKNYNQHWLFQEAELRRISEQKSGAAQSRHVPEVSVPFYHQHANNSTKYFVDKNKSPMRIARPEPSSRKDFAPHGYLNHSQTGHALPMPYNPPPVNEGQDVMLSISGKKKCSYCGNELGRGAAMIIESLSMFYHMECFKCCVCHMELGDGLMGTDVEVRNHKLHCHNCHSSDDGIKFSCV